MSKSQKEFYLREQLKAIKQELGEDAAPGDVLPGATGVHLAARARDPGTTGVHGPRKSPRRSARAGRYVAPTEAQPSPPRTDGPDR